MGRSQLRGGQLERHTGYLGLSLGGTLGAGASPRGMEDSVFGVRGLEGVWASMGFQSSTVSDPKTGLQEVRWGREVSEFSGVCAAGPGRHEGGPSVERDSAPRSCVLGDREPNFSGGAW